MFRKRKPVKLLSADELKSKLYAHFDKTGSLNQMKTEIRGKLVTELFKMTPPLEPSDAQPSSGFEKTLLPLQVCNWLVYDHLFRQGYQYALSTFVAEAAVTHPEQLLTAGDILSLFGLDSASSEYKSISRMYSVNNQRDLLHSLLLAVVKSLLDFTPNEEAKNKKVDTGAKEDEALFERVGVLEDSKFNEKNFVRLRSITRDSSFQEQLQLLKEEKDQEIQVLREKWLNELDRLHSQERTMKEDMDLKKRELQQKLDQIFAEKEKLKEKEYFLTKEYENRLEKRTRELEVEYVSKLHSVENELKISKGKLYDKELRIAQVEADHASLQTKFNSLKRELEEIKQTYKATKDKYSSLLDENTELLRKFENMSDYSIVKRDLEVRSNEVSSLQRQLEEFQMSAVKEKDAALEKIRNLDTKLKHKESLLEESQRQLSTCRETMHREEAVWHREKKKIESDSQESKEMYKNLIKKIEDQREDIQSLHQTIHILHYQLTYSDKKIESKPDGLSKKKGISSHFPSKIETGICRINSTSNNSPYKDDSLKFIEEAKGRIRNLEREANTLRDKCTSAFAPIPSFGNTYSKSGISSQIYNFTNIPNVPIKPFQPNFETLIRNEMPVMDSCLQMTLKNNPHGDVLIENGARGYIPKSPEMKRGMATLFSGLSSLDNYPETSKNSPNVVDVSSVENREASPLNFKERRDLIPKQPSEKSQTDNAHRKLEAEVNIISDVQNKQNSPSNTEKSDLQYQTIEGKMPNSMLENLSTNVPDKCTIANVSSSALHPTYQPNINEQCEKRITSFTSKETFSDTGLTSKNDVSKSEHLDLELPLNDSSRSKAHSSPDLKCTTLSKTLEIDLDSSWKEQMSSKDVSKPDPPRIDLDSAWKRKQSLKSGPDHQPVPSFFSGIDSVWRRKSLISPGGSDSASQISPEKKFSSEVKSDDMISKGQSAKMPDTKENSHANQVEREEMDSLTSPHHAELGSQSSARVDNPKMDKLESERSNANNTSRLNELNNTIEENLVDSDKQTPEYLSSEASDIHLSCGSEPEQPKEDSDNW